jgi:uncharacterized protein YcbK (DUF882 family)
MSSGRAVPARLCWLLWAVGLGSLGVSAYEGWARPARQSVALQSAEIPLGWPDVDVPAPPPVESPALPTLRIYGIGRQSEITVAPFGADGEPLAPALEALEAFFGARSGKAAPIDPRLVAVLMELSRAFDDRPITLISGHREPGRGTRESSYHVKGMAADISIEGVKPHDVYLKAVDLGARGTGLYRNFVHVDVRDAPRYRWGGGYARRRPSVPKR